MAMSHAHGAVITDNPFGILRWLTDFTAHILLHWLTDSAAYSLFSWLT
jgi:hypothetical protein